MKFTVSGWTSPITRAYDTEKVVLARSARHRTIGDALQRWALSHGRDVRYFRGISPARPQSGIGACVYPLRLTAAPRSVTPHVRRWAGAM